MGSTHSESRHTSVLFVCLGNICRSPLAEGIFVHLVDQAGLRDRFEIDSAGTGAWHVGERPDARAEIVASRHGVRLESVARQVTDDDFRRFDYIIAMDKENLRRLQRMALALGSEASVHLLREWDPDADSDEAKGAEFKPIALGSPPKLDEVVTGYAAVVQKLTVKHR